MIKMLESRSAHPSKHVRALNRATFYGFAIIGLFGGTLGLWAVTAKLSGAVVAGGQFVVDTNLKKVQHPTGGIVGELNVREGDFVKEGDLLIRLDDTVTRANLQIIVKQLEEMYARRARLEAERDGIPVMGTPAEFKDQMNDPAVAKLVESERSLFTARAAAREGQKNQLQKRVSQLQDEISGLKAQQTANDRATVLIADELKAVQELYQKNLVPLTRLSALQREAANLEGQRGQLMAAVAQSQGRIAETSLQIIQIDEEMRAEVMKDMREIQGKEAELVERRIAAEDQLKRVDIRSPVTGFVHQLAAHTVGGVITPADPAMSIIPVNDTLNLEVKVMPNDIDQLRVGQPATVRVHASNARNTPELEATLTRISADVTKDPQQGYSYYTARVSISPEQLKRLGTLKLVAGMQAEVFVQTSERTPFQYIIKPLRDQIARTFRET